MLVLVSVIAVVLIAAGSLRSDTRALVAYLEEARTAAFCTMVTFEWFVAFNARSDEHTVFKLGLFTNRAMLFALGGAVALQLIVVYVPPAQHVFKTVPLTFGAWASILAVGFGIFLLETTRKRLFPKLFSRGKWRAA